MKHNTQQQQHQHRNGPARVVVIGGGLAGIYAARTIHELAGQSHSSANHGQVEVILLEAQDALGGRVQQIPDDHFRNLPGGKRLEIGAEFLHGDGSIFNHYVDNVLKLDKVFSFDLEHVADNPDDQPLFLHYRGRLHIPGDHPDLVQLGEALGLLSEPQEIQQQHAVLRDILARNEDISVGQYLREMGVPKRLMGIADAIFSKTAGTDLESNGLRDTILEQQQWPYGSKNYQFRTDYSRDLVQHLASGLPDVRLNWPVQSVEYSSGSGKKITIRRKMSHETVDNVDYVIVTVPLSILKNKSICFVPELPPFKQRAIQGLQMFGAIKTICLFKKQFWKPKFRNLRLIIVADDPVYAQCWMPTMPNDPEWDEKPAIVTGFLTGDTADEITERMKRGEIDEQWMIDRFMACLDNVFQPELGSDFSVRNLFLEGHCYNWGLNEYIKGGYSSHGIGCTNARDQIARPVDNKLFFAGEATTVRAPSTVQGAMDSGARAARQVLMQHHLDRHAQILAPSCNCCEGHPQRDEDIISKL